MISVACPFVPFAAARARGFGLKWSSGDGPGPVVSAAFGGGRWSAQPLAPSWMSMSAMTLVCSCQPGLAEAKGADEMPSPSKRRKMISMSPDEEEVERALLAEAEQERLAEEETERMQARTPGKRVATMRDSLI